MATDTTTPLDPVYVPEVDETLAPAARQVGNWTAAYAKATMDDFSASVASDAKAASSANSNAQKAAQATATDLQKTKEAQSEAEQAAQAAEGEVALAAAQVTQAQIQALEAAQARQTALDAATASAASAEEAADIVRRFNPWINQYGYSKIVPITTPLYKVTVADVGKTLVFDRNARVELPAPGTTTFPESFFFHVATADPAHRVWIDYDLDVTLTHPEHCLPLVEGCYRGTVQMFSTTHWHLFDPVFDPDTAFNCLTDQSFTGQSHRQQYALEDISSSYRLALYKQHGQLYGWSQDLVTGIASNVSIGANKVSNLPDGPLNWIYANHGSFTSGMLFGVYGAYDTLLEEFGWYWGDAGFGGNIYSLKFEGYLPNDWYISDLTAYAETGVKFCWVEFSSRSLKDSNGKPVTHSKLFTSTDGFNWFVNLFAAVNTHIGARKVIAHFPISLIESGRVYLKELDGSITLLEYKLTEGTFTETEVADGHDSTLQCKYWDATGSFALVFKNSTDVVMITYTKALNALKSTTLTNVNSVVGTSGDTKRCSSITGILKGGTEISLYEWVVDSQYPNGSLLKTVLATVPVNDEWELAVAGQYLDDTQEGLVGYCLLQDTLAMKFYGINGETRSELAWGDQLGIGGGQFQSSSVTKVPAFYTNLGIWKHQTARYAAYGSSGGGSGGALDPADLEAIALLTAKAEQAAVRAETSADGASSSDADAKYQVTKIGNAVAQAQAGASEASAAATQADQDLIEVRNLINNFDPNSNTGGGPTGVSELVWFQPDIPEMATAGRIDKYTVGLLAEDVGKTLCLGDGLKLNIPSENELGGWPEGGWCYVRSANPVGYNGRFYINNAGAIICTGAAVTLSVPNDTTPLLMPGKTYKLQYVGYNEWVLDQPEENKNGNLSLLTSHDNTASGIKNLHLSNDGMVTTGGHYDSTDSRLRLVYNDVGVGNSSVWNYQYSESDPILTPLNALGSGDIEFVSLDGGINRIIFGRYDASIIQTNGTFGFYLLGSIYDQGFTPVPLTISGYDPKDWMISRIWLTSDSGNINAAIRVTARRAFTQVGSDGASRTYAIGQQRTLFAVSSNLVAWTVSDRAEAYSDLIGSDEVIIYAGAIGGIPFNFLACIGTSSGIYTLEVDLASTDPVDASLVHYDTPGSSGALRVFARAYDGYSWCVGVLVGELSGDKTLHLVGRNTSSYDDPPAGVKTCTVSGLAWAIENQGWGIAWDFVLTGWDDTYGVKLLSFAPYGSTDDYSYSTPWTGWDDLPDPTEPWEDRYGSRLKPLWAAVVGYGDSSKTDQVLVASLGYTGSTRVFLGGEQLTDMPPTAGTVLDEALPFPDAGIFGLDNRLSNSDTGDYSIGLMSTLGTWFSPNAMYGTPKKGGGSSSVPVVTPVATPSVVFPANLGTLTPNCVNLILPDANFSIQNYYLPPVTGACVLEFVIDSTFATNQDGSLVTKILINAPSGEKIFAENTSATKGEANMIYTYRAIRDLQGNWRINDLHMSYV